MAPAPERFLDDPDSFLDDVQRRWLAPLGPVRAIWHRFLHGLTFCAIRTMFRLEVTGLGELPDQRPMIFAPSHQSSLDGPVLSAALPYRTLRHTYWAVGKGKALANRLLRLLNRTVRTIPIDRDLSESLLIHHVRKNGIRQPD